MMGEEIGGEGVVAMFCPDCTETSTIRRAQGFVDQGHDVIVFSFRRGRYNSDFVPPWPCIDLGRTADGRYWHRLLAVFLAFPVVVREAARLRRATAFHARNLDQLLLVVAVRWLLRSAVPVVYEVLDIPQVMVGRRPTSFLLRSVERLCLRQIKLLVVSSPGFHTHYFAKVQRFRGEWMLLENKLHDSIPAAAPEGRRRHAGWPRRAGRPWVIGYFGLIRGDATLDLIARVAERLGDRVRLCFRGILTTVDQARFSAVLRRCPNITFEGPYVNPQDLAAIYEEVDFAWAIDLEHCEHNSRWLLPCRFYEAGFFGVPCLAVREFEIGSMIDRLGIGWTFSAPLEDALVRFFESVTPEQYEERQRRLQRQPRSLFVGEGEMAELCARLQPARPAPQPPGPTPVPGRLTGEA